MPTAAGMYYALYDDGNKDQPPVILIHGAGSNHTIWPAEIRRLAGQRVLAVDLPGHGRSTGVALQTISAYADQMIELLAALGQYQAVFVGHAMGGAIALDIAARHPNNVAGLGLIATGAYLGVDRDFLENLGNPVTVSTAMAAFQAKAFGPGASPLVANRYMQTLREARPSVLYGDWRACAEFDLREKTTHVETPTWIITGGEDQLTPVAYAHFLAERLPAARLQVIQGAGHMVILEQTGKVVQGLQQFLLALAQARFSASRVRLPSPAQISAMQKKNF